MPQAIPQPAPVSVRDLILMPPTGSGATPVGGSPGSGVTPLPLPAGPSERFVEITFSADRNQLLTAWNAVANLADLAGKVSVTVHAESQEGFDRSKLQNGVVEPLREADLIE